MSPSSSKTIVRPSGDRSSDEPRALVGRELERLGRRERQAAAAGGVVAAPASLSRNRNCRRGEEGDGEECMSEATHAESRVGWGTGLILGAGGEGKQIAGLNSSDRSRGPPPSDEFTRLPPRLAESPRTGQHYLPHPSQSAGAPDGTQDPFDAGNGLDWRTLAVAQSSDYAITNARIVVAPGNGHRRRHDRHPRWPDRGGWRQRPRSRRCVDAGRLGSDRLPGADRCRYEPWPSESESFRRRHQRWPAAAAAPAPEDAVAGVPRDHRWFAARSMPEAANRTEGIPSTR